MTNCVWVLGLALLMIAIERYRPGRQWRPTRWWLARAVLLNGVQAGIAVVATMTWDRWFRALPLHVLWLWPHSPSLSVHGGHFLGLIGGALFGYLVITFVYYWWHRARHASAFLWRHLHQLHHSAGRIEVLTSFYKHPLEIAVNGVLSSAIVYLLCGLNPAQAGLAVLLTGFAELFYHWNVKTPHWLGYWFQRPEMHCVHHQQGHHHHNYSDLPLWDLLFGTFHNPPQFDARCGLGETAELRLGALLRGVDIHIEQPEEKQT